MPVGCGEKKAILSQKKIHPGGFPPGCITEVKI